MPITIQNAITKKRGIKRVGNCSLCVSPLRPKIESLIKKEVPLPDIARAFYQEWGIGQQTLYLKIRNHILKKHPPRIVDFPKEVEKVEAHGSNSFTEYAQKLLDVGLSEEMMNSKKISHNAVIGAQRVLIEKEKLKTQQDALKIAMVKMFRGHDEEIDRKIIDGEVVDAKQIAFKANSK